MRMLMKTVCTVLLVLATAGGPLIAQAAAMRVVNRMSDAIAYVYISPSWTSNFRDQDQMLGGDQYIMPGEIWDIEFQGGSDCYFDLRAIFVDGHKIDRYEANLCEGRTWTLGT